MSQQILIVDDEPGMIKLLERIFGEKTSYPIVTTSNSLEVPKLLEGGGFDLIITDLKMPGMDGMDILKMVRDQERFEQVIVITAFGSLETAIEALTHGAFDYITKPFKKEQILHTVQRAMRWQLLRKEAEQMRQVFDREPYETAAQAFQQEYVRRLSDRNAGDRSAIAERSGLAPEAIAAILDTMPPSGG